MAKHWSQIDYVTTDEAALIHTSCERCVYKDTNSYGDKSSYEHTSSYEDMISYEDTSSFQDISACDDTSSYEEHVLLRGHELARGPDLIQGYELLRESYDNHNRDLRARLMYRISIMYNMPSSWTLLVLIYSRDKLAALLYSDDSLVTSSTDVFSESSFCNSALCTTVSANKSYHLVIFMLTIVL